MRANILENNLWKFGFAGLIITLFYAFFGRGLYFKPELLTALMLIAVVFAIAVLEMVLRGKTDFFRVPVDYFVTALAISYLLASFGAVSQTNAELGVIKNLGYLAVFVATSQLVRTWRDYRVLLQLIFTGGVLVALIGILAAVGTFPYPGAYESKSILSTLQYANAMAILMVMTAIIGFALLARGRTSPLKETAYLLGLLLIQVALLGTQSRAVWLLYPCLVLLWMMGLSKELRARLWLLVSYSIIAAILISQRFFKQIELGETKQALSVLLAASLVTLLAWIAIRQVNSFIKHKPLAPAVRKFWQGLGVAYLVIVLGIYGVYQVKALPAGWATIVPAEVTSQLATVSSTDTSFATRFVFYGDALKIISDYPWLGTGAGGWEMLYTRYRSLPYLTLEVHNGYLQVMLETGILGLISYLGVWLALGYTAYRLYRRRKKEPHWPIIWGVIISLLAIALHSMIDFDLSLPTLFMLTWCLAALLRNARWLSRKEQPTAQLVGVGRWAVALLGLGFAVAMLLPAYRLDAAGQLGAEGAQAMSAGNLSKAQQKLQAASQSDPKNANYQADLAKISMVYWIKNKDQAQLKQGISLAQQAVQKEPANLTLRGNLITIYLIADRFSEAQQLANQLVQDNPLDIKTYEILADVGITGANYYRQKAQQAPAQLLLAKVVAIPEQLAKLRAQVQRQSGSYSLEASFLQMTPQLKLSVGQADLLLNQAAKARPLLEQAIKE